jgi:hypothetical protein
VRRLVALTCPCWRPPGTVVDRSTLLTGTPMARQPRFVAVRLSDASSPRDRRRSRAPNRISSSGRGCSDWFRLDQRL